MTTPTCFNAYKNGRRSSPVGIVDGSGPDPAKAMEDLAQQGVRGFRIVPAPSARTWLDTPGMLPDALASNDRMCAKHPYTQVVIDHMERIGADGEIRDFDVKVLCGLAQHSK